MSDNGDIVHQTCKDDDAENSTSHWVEELFPPTFRLSLQELVDGSVTTAVQDRHGRKLLADSATGENNDDLFAKLARRISPLDVDAIKNVYQRVWLMMKADGSKSKYLCNFCVTLRCCLIV